VTSTGSEHRSTGTRRGRAAPLAPEERRASIVRAVLPLLAAHGRDVTTRQIAEAAGVAEGTIFRVFADKEELLAAALAQALDVGELLDGLDRLAAELAAGPGAATPERVVTAIVELVRARIETVYQVLFLVRRGPPPAGPPAGAIRRPGAEHDDRVDAKIAGLLGSVLVGDPALDAARWIRLTTMAATHPMMTHGRPLAVDEIVARILHGILHAVRPEAPAVHEAPEPITALSQEPTPS